MIATQAQTPEEVKRQQLLAMLGPAAAAAAPLPLNGRPAPAATPQVPQLFPQAPPNPTGSSDTAAPVPAKPLSTPGYGPPAAPNTEAAYMQQHPMAGGTAPPTFTPETGKHALLRGLFSGMSEFGRPGAGFAQNAAWDAQQDTKQKASEGWPLQRQKNINEQRKADLSVEGAQAQIEASRSATKKNERPNDLTTDELAAKIVEEAQASNDPKKVELAMNMADRLKSMGKTPGKWTLQRDPTGNIIGAQSPDGQIMPLTDPNVPQGLLSVAGKNEVKPTAATPAALAGMQAGPQPKTPEYAGQAYPDLASAVNAWAQKAQEIYVQGQKDIATARGEAYGGFRGVPIIDPETGTVRIMYTKDAIAANAAPANQGASLMSKEAQIGDIEFASQQAREAIENLEPLDAGSIATLTMAMRETDPTIHQRLMDTIMGSQQLSPNQRAFVTWIGQLNERAMSLRNIAGMGQGAQDLRTAIMNTLPGIKSGDKKLMLQQLDAFDNQVRILKGGIPTVNHPAAPGSFHVPTDAPAAPKEDGHKLMANGKEIAVSKGGQWVKPPTP